MLRGTPEKLIIGRIPFDSVSEGLLFVGTASAPGPFVAKLRKL
jgi:hypothetical protein